MTIRDGASMGYLTASSLQPAMPIINARGANVAFRIRKRIVDAATVVREDPLANHGCHADPCGTDSLRETVIMKHASESIDSLPVQDYSRAIHQAVDWLGERYLLAVPVRAIRQADRRRHYFADTPPWISRRGQWRSATPPEND